MGNSTDPTDLRARLALLGIFRDLGIPVGDALSTTEITGLWPEQGVRAEDLAGAIEGLVRDGLLARAHDAPQRLVLTAVGETWLRAQPAWLEYRLVVMRAARARARRREGDLAPRVVFRRRNDPPTLIAGQ